MTEADAPYGLREDGTPKGEGYFGLLSRPDGRVSSEISESSEVDGQELFYPLLVPSLTHEEVQLLLSGGEPTEAIREKAIQHAIERMRAGLNPFAKPGEQVAPPQAPEAPAAPTSSPTPRAPSVPTVEE